LKPGLKYSEIKKELIQVIWDYFAPHRDKRNELAGQKDFIRDIMREGAKKTKLVARTTMESVREKVGLKY